MPRKPTFLDYDMSPTPRQIEGIYAAGFAGTRPDDVADIAVQGTSRTFYSSFPDAKAMGEGRLSLPYRAVLSLEPQFGRYEAQTTGDCVSHSTRNAGMIDYCVDAMFGETTYEGRFATENIYGYRGHGGQGASCSRLALYVGQKGPGGFLVRKKHGEGRQSVDLSRYDSGIGHRWGRRGTPAWLNKIAATNKALRVYRCKSIDEARDALSMGFGLSRCGWWGYSNRRNSDGVANVKGRWSHAMACIGCDDTPQAHREYGGPLFLIQNSWGRWNSGPKAHEQPDGSFWITPRRFSAEIEAGGVFVIASVRGFNRELVYDQAANIRELSDA